MWRSRKAAMRDGAVFGAVTALALWTLCGGFAPNRQVHAIIQTPVIREVAPRENAPQTVQLPGATKEKKFQPIPVDSLKKLSGEKDTARPVGGSRAKTDALGRGTRLQKDPT